MPLAPALSIHVIHRGEKEPAAEVRCFADMVVERLRSDSPLNRVSPTRLPLRADR